MEEPESFGEQLRHYRTALRLSQQALADRARISRNSISDLERGVSRAAHRDSIARLATALGLAGEERARFAAAVVRRRARPAGPPLLTTLPLSPLLGRTQEETALGRLLCAPGVRLVTITGPGGVGKTRLAVAVAATVHGSFPDGIVFVDLASLEDSALVVSTVAHAAGIKESGPQPVLDQLAGVLAGRRLLLLLDNMDHLLDATPEILQLLHLCPDLSALVTSRAALRVRGEHCYPLGPLPVPDTAASLDEVERSAAVALFVARASAVRPSVAFQKDTAGTIAQICRLLDGLPLALELAAAHVSFLSLPDLLRRLSEGLSLLADGARDLPPRQQTMSATIAWSYDRLSDDEQALVRRLAVFAGGWTLEAAEVVCVGGPVAASAVLRLVGRLVAASLVVLRGEEGGVQRFGMLETIRAFAQEALAASGEVERVSEAYAAYYLRLAERAAEVMDGTEQHTGLSLLNQEYGNLRAAIAWGIARRRGAFVETLALALWPFWLTRRFIEEGRGALEVALAGPIGPGQGHRPRFSLLTRAGICACLQHDHARATTLFEDAVALAQAHGDEAGMAEALIALGGAATLRGDHDGACRWTEQSVAISRRCGFPHSLAAALNNLGHSLDQTGQSDQAIPLLEESLALLGQHSTVLKTLPVLNTLATAHRHLAQDERAAALYAESAAAAARLGDHFHGGVALVGQAVLARRRGVITDAADLCLRGLAPLDNHQNPWVVASGLETLAGLLGDLHATDSAARVLGAAAALRAQSAITRPPADEEQYRRDLARIQTASGAFTASWDDGWGRGLAEVLADATASLAASRSADSARDVSPR